MRLKRYIAFDASIFSLVWLLLFMAGQSKLFRDPGTFFHTVAGERILDTGHLIHQDSFSFTRFGEPWIAQQWLGECIIAVMHWIAGYVKADGSAFEAWTKTYRYDLALLLPYSNYRKYFEGNPEWRVVKRCPSAIL